MRVFPSPVGFAVLLAVSFDLPAQDGRLGIEKLLEWESVSSPRLSPDGRRIVFVRSWNDQVADRRVSDLWIMDADGSRPRFLVRGGSPRWSPDGRRLAYLAEGEPRGRQIWVLWVETREATQITRVHESPADLRWSPDGKRIAFSMTVPAEPKLRVRLPKRPEGAKWAPEPRVVSRLLYRRDRRGYLPLGHRHLFVVDATGGTPRQVTSGDYDHGAGEWTKDGRRLIFSAKRFPDADWRTRESEIYSVEVASGRIEQLVRRPGRDDGPVVSPDGRWIAWLGGEPGRDTYTISKVHVAQADGSGVRVLGADLDRRPSGLSWAPGSDAVLATVASAGERHLYRFDLASGRASAVTRGAMQVRITDVQGDLAVGTHTDPARPRDVATVSLGTGEVRRLTRVNDDVLEGVRLGRVEEMRCTSADGLSVQGWIVYPPDFDPARKHPLILQIHGGPHGMYGVDFSFERQNHAAAGYVVLYTNPRGSDGYGKAFGNAIQNAYPGRDYDDLMAAVDAVVERGFVDPKRLFVYGGSGGGVLTAWVVGRTDRFAAAVSMYPVTNWISFVGTTDGPYWYENFAKLPWESIEEHWRRSPLRLAGRVRTPIMFLTGELDLRTPISQTEELYQALKLRKVDTVMVRVPGEYHGAAGRRVSNRLRRILFVREWFERHDPARRATPAPAAGRRAR